MLGRLGEGAREERLDRRRRVGAERRDQRRVLEQDAREHRHRVIGLERGAAGEALEEHGAEREDVGARANVGGAPRLVGRQVRRRSD